MIMWRNIAVILLFISLGFPGCFGTEESEQTLVLATTTSMRDSGLLDILLPIFTKETGIEVKVVAVGTGAALRLGEAGDADVLIVHSPEKEVNFITEGHGVSRITFAWNRFVIVGPTKMSDFISITNAFQWLSEKCFISRGDQSGTHLKEQEIWLASELQPEGTEYFSIGQGMGSALNMADELQCYTLTDEGTWMHMSQQLELVASSWDDELTVNPYSIIQLSDTEEAHAIQAQLLEDFLLSSQGQELIAGFTISGQVLFNAGQPNQEPSSND